MARTRVPVSAVGIAGVTPPVETAGDVTNGNYIVIDSTTVVIMRNVGTVARTVTVHFTYSVEGQPVVPRVYTLAPGTTRMYGPFNTGWYGSALQLNASSAEVKLSAVKLSIGAAEAVTVPGGGGGGGGTDPAAAYDTMILADGPQGYWTLKNTAAGVADATGNGHNGTAVGSPSVTTWVDGSAALAFNGTSQYIEIPDSADLSPAGGAITVEAWMAPAVTTFSKTERDEGEYIHWLGKIGPNPSDNTKAEYAARMYQFAPPVADDRSNRQSFYSFNPTATADNPNHLGAGSYAQDVITVNQWAHFVMVINTTTGLVKLYKNGQLRDTDTLASYNITPQHTTAPLRIGTANLDSFFQGKIARVAVYDYELSPTQAYGHYRAMVAPPVGTAGFVRHIGSAGSTVNVSRLQLTVGATGVPVGATLLARTVSEYTVSGTTMLDSAGNTWVRDRTGVDAGNLIRVAAFSCQVQTALKAGDVIEMRTPVSVAAKSFAVDQFENLAYVASTVSNSTTATSTTPGTTLAIVTPDADSVVHGALGVSGPTADSITADVGNDMTVLTRRGTNSGGTDVTVNGAFKSTLSTGTQRWQPTLGTSRPWVEILAAYKAGQPVLSPPAVGTANPMGVFTSGKSVVSSTTLVMTVTPNEGAVAGQTLTVTVSADYTAAAPTVTDSKGNSYSLTRTGADAGTTVRAALFSCAVSAALVPNDTITVTFPSAITRKSASVLQFAGVLTPVVVDVQNGVAAATGSPSTTLTTVTADTVLVAAVAMAGPSDAAFIPDVSWTPAPAVGGIGAGANDRTVYPAYRPVAAAGGYTFAPVLEGTYAYAAVLAAYRAGVVTGGTSGFSYNPGAPTVITADDTAPGISAAGSVLTVDDAVATGVSAAGSVLTVTI